MRKFPHLTWVFMQLNSDINQVKIAMVEHMAYTIYLPNEIFMTKSNFKLHMLQMLNVFHFFKTSVDSTFSPVECAFLVKVSVINNSMCIYRTTEIIKLKVTCSQNCIQLKVRGKRFFPLSTKWNPNILSVQLNSIDIE